MAFAPCLLGYGIIAKRLWDDPETVGEGDNRYWKWIRNYVADDYRAAVVAGEGGFLDYFFWKLDVGLGGREGGGMCLFVWLAGADARR